MPKGQKSPRLAAIEALPNEMQDYALVDWATVAVLTGNEDVDYARKIYESWRAARRGELSAQAPDLARAPKIHRLAAARPCDP